MNTNKPQYSLSFKNGKSNNSAEYFDSYPTRRQIYEFVSKYFSVEEIALVILDELVKKGSYVGFEITYGFIFNEDKNG